MRRSMGLLLFLLWTTAEGTQRIGCISNASYSSSNWTDMISFSSTCEECLCHAFSSSNAADYQGFNCYTNTRTCVFFAGDLSPPTSSTLQLNRDCKFFFKKSESVQTSAEVTSTTPTSMPLYVTLNWNTTAIVLASAGTSLSSVNHSYGIFIPANSDTFYIADSDNHRVSKWLPNATTGVLMAGGQGKGSNVTQLNDPREVCIDRHGNLYVADSGNYRIQYFPNGSTIGYSIAGNGSIDAVNNALGNILGLGVDLAGNVYVSDYDRARVTKWTPNATSGVRVAGNGTQGNSPYQLNIPTAFYTDPLTGTLYVPNQAGHCVTKWSPGSSFGVVVAGACGRSGTNETLLTSPKSVTFDKYGNMYVVDGVNNGRIIMFYPGSLVGKPIVTSGLNNPISIAIDTRLTLFVSDWNNNRVVKYQFLD